VIWRPSVNAAQLLSEIFGVNTTEVALILFCIFLYKVICENPIYYDFFSRTKRKLFYLPLAIVSFLANALLQHLT
jgi:hypothetical protein